MKITQNLLLVVFFYACSNPKTDGVIKIYEAAGENRKEIIKVVDYFFKSNDSFRIKSALFILQNMVDKKSINDGLYEEYINSIFSQAMPIGTEKLNGLWKSNYIELVNDVTKMKSEDIIFDIEEAITIWENSKWRNEIPFDIFLEYILPYRTLEEKFVAGWRSTLQKKYKHLIEDVENPEIAFVKVLTHLKKLTREASSNFKYPIDVLTMDYLLRGTCSQLNVFYVAVLRSLGLPVAYDFIPSWGNYSQTGHSWVSFIDKNGKTKTLAEGDSILRELNPIDASTFKEHEELADKRFNISKEKTVYKVFRKNFSYHRNENAIKNISLNLPAGRDVSVDYHLKQSIRLDVDSNDIAVTLSIFRTGKDWEAFIIAAPENRKVEFHNLGPNVVYLPTFYKRNGDIYQGTPFYIDTSNFLYTFSPSESLTSAKLYRKYPIFGNWVAQWNRMLGGRIEFSESPNFDIKKAKYTIHETPVGRFFVEFNSCIKARYFRYLCPQNSRTPLAEIRIFDDKNKKITPVRYFGEKIEDETIAAAFDDDHLTSAQTKTNNYILGAALTEKNEKSKCVSKLEVVPKNDGNFVVPGDKYELFYFHNKWISLGVQVAKEHELYFDNIPVNSLLVLRNLSRGNEERIFSLQKGSQLWW